jgi:hypothetical protein
MNRSNNWDDEINHIMDKLFKNMRVGNFDAVWQNGQFIDHIEIQRVIQISKKLYGWRHDVAYIVQALEQMGKEIKLEGPDHNEVNDHLKALKEHFTQTNNDDTIEFKGTPRDLSWYYMPHYCFVYNTIVWRYLSIATGHLFYTIYCSDHFVCVDSITNEVYDLELYIRLKINPVLVLDQDVYIASVKRVAKYVISHNFMLKIVYEHSCVFPKENLCVVYQCQIIDGYLEKYTWTKIVPMMGESADSIRKRSLQIIDITKRQRCANETDDQLFKPDEPIEVAN